MAFKKGQSGNPKGRPQGAKNKSPSITADLDALGRDAVSMAVKVIDAAVEDGDYASAAKLVDRMLTLIYPAPVAESVDGAIPEKTDPRFEPKK